MADAETENTGQEQEIHHPGDAKQHGLPTSKATVEMIRVVYEKPLWTEGGVYAGKTLVRLGHTRGQSHDLGGCGGGYGRSNARDVEMKSMRKVIFSAPALTVSAGDADRNTKTKTSSTPPTLSKGNLELPCLFLVLRRRLEPYRN